MKKTVENETLFVERQKFRQWWLWLVLLGVNVLFIYGAFQQIVLGQQFGGKPMSDSGLLISAGFTALVSLLIVSFRLETKINEDGVYIRFFPFHLKFKFYSWDFIRKSYLRQYSPLGEYGGWGLRIGLFGKGTAYNVSGNWGLQLEFTNKKKLLIGTARPEELTSTLESIDRLNA